MAPQIKRIAQRHLRTPQEITIKSKTTTATDIRQRYWVVSGMHKLDALTRILEVESFDAMLVFVRTKQSTVELAEKLQARGFAAAALNGDLQQSQRERTVAQLKAGQIDILVATDVAARGLDVERIGHVVNFDVPYDTESYVHRIGRTGRAGRSGEAILFIAPRERNMLHAIERATRQPIENMALPTIDDVNAKRVAKFKERIAAALTSEAAGTYRAVVEEFAHETGADIVDVAAALAQLAQGKTPLLLSAKRAVAEEERSSERERTRSGEEAPARRGRGSRFDPQEMYRLEVGSAHGVQPGNIVGAIANEARLDGSQINGIDIRGDHSFVRLPEDMPPAVLARLQRVRVKGQLLAISRVERRPPPNKAARRAERERKAR
jgi:ATP-dependent RNA helicase DeaD